jgi:hypothetical protein
VNDDEFRQEAERQCLEESGYSYRFLRRVGELEAEVMCIPPGCEDGPTERWNLLQKMVELRLRDAPIPDREEFVCRICVICGLQR